MYSDRRGTDKNHPGRNLPDKRPPDKPPNKSPRELTQRHVHVGLCMHVLLKIGGSEMCDILQEVPRCVTKFDRGRESKLVQNSVTYFMDFREMPLWVA